MRRSITLAAVVAFAGAPFLATTAHAADYDTKKAATVYAYGGASVTGQPRAAIVNVTHSGTIVPGDTGTTETTITNGGSNDARLVWGYWDVTASNNDLDDLKMTLESDTETTVGDAKTKYKGASTFTETGRKNVAKGGTGTVDWKWAFPGTASVPVAGSTMQTRIGAQMLALTTPEAPAVKDVPGSANDSVTAPADTDLLDYSAVTYDKTTGNWSMDVDAKEGVEFKDALGGSFTEYTYTGKTNPNDLAVTLRVPTVTDNSGAGDNVTINKDQEGVTYSDPTRGAAPNFTMRNDDYVWTFTATPKAGYALVTPANLPAGTKVTMNADGTATYEVLTSSLNTITNYIRPTVTGKAGFLDDAVKFEPANSTPTSGGVIYDEGKYDQRTGVWSQVLRAAEGSVFSAANVPDGALLSADRKTLTLQGKLDVTPRSVAVQNPISTDKPGTADDTVTAPADTADVKYTVDYTKGATSWTVTATAQKSDVALTVPAGSNGVLSADGKTVKWTGTFATKGDLKLVKPVAPKVIDKPGYKDDSVTPVKTEGVNYELNYDQAYGEWLMIATPAEGYAFESGQDTEEFSGQLEYDGTGTTTPPGTTNTGNTGTTTTGNTGGTGNNPGYTLPQPNYGVAGTSGTTGTNGTTGTTGTTATKGTTGTINSGEQTSGSMLAGLVGLAMSAIGAGMLAIRRRFIR